MKKRFLHDLSHLTYTSFMQGELVPLTHFEVNPGDTIEMSSSVFMRSAPLVRPLMHPVQMKIHHWFVPYRLLWDKFEDFITGGPDGDDASEFPYKSLSSVDVGTLSDYLGIPDGAYSPSFQVSALPYRGYTLIFNNFYRDQDLVAPLAFSRASGLDTTTNGLLQMSAWEKDYFTTCRPFESKGPDITVPIGDAAPVVAAGTGIPTFNPPTGAPSALRSVASQGAVSWDASQGSNADVPWANPALEADLSAATGISIRELRRLLALQRFQENRAMYGSRYVEYLKFLGAHPADARLQLPEYLGGGVQTVQFSEVLQTTPTEETPLGDMAGHGVGAMKSNKFRKTFQEHGIVMSLVKVLPRTIYANAVHRSWLRRTKEDFWQPELELIGQQEVTNREVYSKSATPTDRFGYQNRYDDMRHMESRISGEFRTVLKDYHMAREFSSQPVLNSSFVTSNPRSDVYADTVDDQVYMAVHHRIAARRFLGPQRTPQTF